MTATVAGVAQQVVSVEQNIANVAASTNVQLADLQATKVLYALNHSFFGSW